MRIYQNLLECNLTSGTNIGCLYMHFLHSHFLRFSSNLLLIAPVLSLDLFCKLTRDKRLKRGQIKVCSRADRSWKGVDCRDTQKCFLLRWVTIAPILHIFERLVVYSRLFEWIDGPLARGAAGSRNALVRQFCCSQLEQGMRGVRSSTTCSTCNCTSPWSHLKGWQPYSLMGSNCQHFAEAPLKVWFCDRQMRNPGRLWTCWGSKAIGSHL
jgi:hypothetical protein